MQADGDNQQSGQGASEGREDHAIPAQGGTDCTDVTACAQGGVQLNKKLDCQCLPQAHNTT